MLKGRLQGVAAQIHVRLEQVREREEKRKNIAKGSANRMDQFLFIYLSISSPEDILTDFREKGEGRGRVVGGEKHRCEGETSIDCLTHALTRAQPITFWCVGQCFRQLSHTGQGCCHLFLKMFLFLSLMLPLVICLKGFGSKHLKCEVGHVSYLQNL